uniref:Uncharacterized protein n=2 Tax=Candidatus Kentrum eta TaxID=2126337 RepID=A0A450U677_9GAMM|nr:MAG: hypothetical protein BECKH772A_GA0070896_100025 [Candidatus Kentron sp. H]VFJ94926.1 MAG: hypothetical protein BECKH772C_GA0070978_1000152 [Candidatus Kentron sp. H]
MIDGSMEFFQETLGGFQALHVGEPLRQTGEDGGVEIEGPSVLLDEAGGVVGDGLALRAATSFDYRVGVHQ